MAYPTGLKIFIDGIDATFYIFGANTFDPDDITNTFRDIDITPYLRKAEITGLNDRRHRSDASQSNLHTIEITALDGNGRVECRVETR
jgi:hypothetical protein